jgi:hypothetical protein
MYALTCYCTSRRTILWDAGGSDHCLTTTYEYWMRCVNGKHTKMLQASAHYPPLEGMSLMQIQSRNAVKETSKSVKRLRCLMKHVTTLLLRNVRRSMRGNPQGPSPQRTFHSSVCSVHRAVHRSNLHISIAMLHAFKSSTLYQTPSAVLLAIHQTIGTLEAPYPVHTCQESDSCRTLLPRSRRELSRTFHCGRAQPCCKSSQVHAWRNLLETSPCHSSGPQCLLATPHESPTLSGCSSSWSVQNRGTAPYMHVSRVKSQSMYAIVFL